MFPYALRNLAIERANEVWARDITYIPMARGWVYLVAVLDWASRRVPAHLIADNCGTHKHPEVRDWLLKHPRFTCTLCRPRAPGSTCWGASFRDLGEEAIREGSVSSLRHVTLAIEIYLAERNPDPKPYRWRAKGADILAKIQRARQAMARHVDAAGSTE